MFVADFDTRSASIVQSVIGLNHDPILYHVIPNGRGHEDGYLKYPVNCDTGSEPDLFNSTFSVFHVSFNVMTRL